MSKRKIPICKSQCLSSAKLSFRKAATSPRYSRNQSFCHILSCTPAKNACRTWANHSTRRVIMIHRKKFVPISLAETMTKVSRGHMLPHHFVVLYKQLWNTDAHLYVELGIIFKSRNSLVRYILAKYFLTSLSHTYLP